jgi:hypothetical protein
MAVLISILRSSKHSTTDLELAALTLLELSFNEDVRQILKSPRLSLRRAIARALKRTESSAARHNMEQLAWVLQRGTVSASTPATSGGHVMISYSWTHQVPFLFAPSSVVALIQASFDCVASFPSPQTVMVKLARMLQHAGHNVWIDVDQMKGSTVEAMAEVRCLPLPPPRLSLPHSLPRLLVHPPPPLLQPTTPFHPLSCFQG